MSIECKFCKGTGKVHIREVISTTVDEIEDTYVKCPVCLGTGNKDTKEKIGSINIDYQIKEKNNGI